MYNKQRKSIRLPFECYNEQGLFFVTLCSKNRDELFGEIIAEDGVLDVPNVTLSRFGKVVEKYIIQMQDFYDNIRIEYFVIMPNHVHMIINVLYDEVNKESIGSSGTPTPTNTVVSCFVSTFKRFCNREIGENIWQRSFHDHIIRNDKDLDRHVEYIINNPLNWDLDKE